MSQNSTSDELGTTGAIFKSWLFLARYIAPVAILFVFLQVIGLL